MVRFILRIKTYFWENPSALFIVCFQISLILCAGLLILDKAALAEGIAVLGFFSLVVGVILNLYSYVVTKKRE
jgi:hypothetical protein